MPLLLDLTPDDADGQSMVGEVAITGQVVSLSRADMLTSRFARYVVASRLSSVVHFKHLEILLHRLRVSRRRRRVIGGEVDCV